MFAFRRFLAPALPVASAAVSCSASAATPAIIACAIGARAFQSSTTTSSSSSSSRDGNRRDYQSRDNNNNSRGGNSSSSSSSSSPSPSLTAPRGSAFTKSGEPFLEINTSSETVASGAGFRLVVTFPASNCSYMDIQYAPQVRDKSDDVAPAAAAAADGDAAAGAGSAADAGRRGDRFARLFGYPVMPLTVRVYPLQMAKLVAVLEGKASEAVIASRLAVGTLKKGSEPGTFIYTVQTRVPKVDDKSQESAEITLTAVQGYMLEKFFGRVMLMGFDPERETIPIARNH